MESRVDIPEWCLSGQVCEPANEDIAFVINHLLANPDLLNATTIVQDAAFMLIVRHPGAGAIWTVEDLPMLAKRQRNVFDRVAGQFKPVFAPVMKEIKAGITPAKMEPKNVND